MKRFLVCCLMVSLLAACAAPSPGANDADGTVQSETLAASLKPAVRAEAEPLRVVATTNLIGDAVQRIAGDRIDLNVLLPAGADPHTYVATPQVMVALGDADVVFVNGLGLEESLIPTLRSDITAPVVSVNETVTPLEGGPHTEDQDADQGNTAGQNHGPYDPHTWQDARNVALWATTIAMALARLDPANAEAYSQAGGAYSAELLALHDELTDTLSVIPAGGRKLVTDHDTFAYFAEAYDFDLVGAVVPSFSTLATVSARERSALEAQIAAEDVHAIFVGTTVNPRLAEQLAADVGVRVVPLYTDSLSAVDGPAATYPDLMRYNAATIADALR